MKRYHLYLSMFFIIASLVIWACGEETTEPEIVEQPPKEMMEEEEMPQEVSREVVLNNVFDNAILPAYNTFLEEAMNLTQSVEFFLNNTSAATLIDLQEQWTSTKLVWERTEVFDIGQINNNFLHNRIDKYPTKIAFLEDNLDLIPPIDEAFVANSGSTAKGLPALEYLLFLAEDDTDILAQFTSGPRATQYRNYILALAKNLETQAIEFQQLLEADRTGFIQNTQDGITGSLNELVNIQISVLEEIINTKINDPLGLSNGSEARPEKVETPFANVSLTAIRANIVGISNSLIADSSQADILDLVDQIPITESVKLSDNITSLITECLETIDSFDGRSLSASVINNKEQVNELTDVITQLLVTIKVDMASRLGITVVFNDTDGD